ncbi:MOSC domain-containing protein [Nocardioides dilutus]
MPVVVTELRRFPVKSCRGEMLDEGLVEPWGLQGDRRWMLVDDHGEAVTIRERKGMLLVHPELRPDGGLIVRDTSGSGLDELVVDIPSGGDTTPVSLFSGTPFEAAVAAASAHEWFSKAVGEPVRLVHAEDPSRRPADPAHAGPGVPVAFADGFPLHLAAEESLADLNDRILAGPMADQGPLPMVRFRPNVVVSGAPAWAEDGWRRLRIGDGIYRSVKGCARCTIPTTDAVTAERGKEPTATLARFRRWDGAVWFGTNLVCDTPGVTIRVGDEVEVLEEVQPAV